MQCRICLETDQPETMMAPCACRGTAMYIHRRCLDEHTRYYPDRMCSVCKTYMKREFPTSEVMSLMTMMVMFGAMAAVSTAHPLTKTVGLLSLGIVTLGFSMRNCLTQDVITFAVGLCVICLFATALLPAILLLVLFGCLYTLGRYIPPAYLFVLAAVALVGLYVAVFMASIIAYVDSYMTSIVFVTLSMAWYGWLKLHPPLRLAAE